MQATLLCLCLRIGCQIVRSCQPVYYSSMLISIMSAKSKSRSKSTRPKVTIPEPDYPFPDSNLFDQLAHLDVQEHESSPLTVLERPQSASGDRLDRELALVQQQKEKLQLELEVLRQRQMTAPPQAA